MSSGTPARPAAESEWERRRRLDEVFGDVLPDITTDEQHAPDELNERSENADDWLRAQVPPHHG